VRVLRHVVLLGIAATHRRRTHALDAVVQRFLLGTEYRRRPSGGCGSLCGVSDSALDVLVTMRFSDGQLERLRGVSPRLRVTRAEPAGADYSRTDVRVNLVDRARGYETR
jgi:hypothetical protein